MLSCRTIDTLPPEMLASIFVYLPLSDFPKVSRLSKRLCAIVAQILSSKTHMKLLFPIYLKRVENLNSQWFIWRRGPLKIEGLSPKFLETSKFAVTNAPSLKEMVIQTRRVESEAKWILLKQKSVRPFKLISNIQICVICELVYIVFILWLGVTFAPNSHVIHYSNATFVEIMELTSLA